MVSQRSKRDGPHIQAGYLLLVVFLVGLVLSAVEAVFALLFGAGLPNWPLAYYLAVPFVMGAFYVLAEFLWEPVGRVLVDADKDTDPAWKRGLRVAVLVFIGSAIVACAVFLKEVGW
jgi:hypothetical protein